MAKERASEDSFTRAFIKPKEPPPDTATIFRDRRRTPRFKLSDCTLICYKDTPLSSIFKRNIAHTIYDLSKEGLRFQTDKHLPIGTRVYIKFQLPKFSDSFEALGVVRWVKELPKEGIMGTQQYHIGIQFNSLSPADAKKIEFMHSWFTSAHGKAKRK